MTLDQLLLAQQKAGKDYQDCVNRLYEAYVTLASIDAALMNSNINPHHTAVNVRTFFPLQADLRPFDHPVYCPLKLPCDWRETISAERDKLVAAFDDRPIMRRAANV